MKFARPRVPVRHPVSSCTPTLLRSRVLCLCLGLVLVATASCDGGSTGAFLPYGADLDDVTLEIAGGDGQQSTVGAAAPQRLSVRVATGSGAGISGLPLLWRFVHGRGSSGDGPHAATVRVTTDAQGRSEVEWELGTVAGVQRATVEIDLAKAAGKKVTFQATALGGAPADVSITPAEIESSMGDVVLLTAHVKDQFDNDLGDGSVQWESTDEDVAKVDGTGRASAVGPGSAEIQARAGAVTGSASMQVVATLAITTESVPEATLDRAYQARLEASGGTAPRVWSIVAGRLPQGLGLDAATGLIDGVPTETGSRTPTFEVTSGDGQQARRSLVVNVVDSSVDVASVSVTPASSDVSVGGGVQLTATPRDADGNALPGRAVSWSTSQSGVATVDQTGAVTAVAEGTATITATSEGQSGTATINVEAAPVASVQVTPSTGSVEIDGTLQLTATPRDADGDALSGRTVTWSSNASGVATVDGNGEVTGVGEGTAIITATSEGKSGTASITVEAAPAPVASVEVSPSTGTVEVDGTLQLTATPKDADGNALSGRTVSWSTNASSVATVDASGEVTGVAEGTATITATSEGESGTATITVELVPVASVDVSPSSGNVLPGGTLQLSAIPRDASGSALAGRTVSWSSGSPSVATVNASGTVTGVAAGSATITATVEGESGSATVTVVEAGPLGPPDPTGLPSIMSGTAQPDWSAYAALDLGNQSSGFSYADPASGALVTKLTDGSTPYSGAAGFGSMYSDGGAYISHPWGAEGDRFTILVFQGDNQRSWLVDYQLGGTLSNWRELTGSMRPGTDIAFTFSNNPATPRIAYVGNGSQIVRIDTESMTMANTGNFPHSASAAVSYWLQMDKNDEWFVWHSGGSQVRAWNSQTDVELSQSWTGINEPRFERGGRYVMLSGQPAFRIWDLETNTLGPQRNLGPMAHNASVDGYFVATDWDYGGYNRMDPSNNGGTFTKVADRMVFDGGETHLSGAWIQGPGNDQWFATADQGNGGWPNSTVMAHFAVALIRADGSDARLVAHTHSNTSGVYWSLPFSNVGPSGHLVIWTSRNSTNGTNSVGDYALYVAEVPR